MNKNKSAIIYGVGLLISILIVYLVFFYEEENIPFNKIEFVEGNNVLNRELPKYMDTIVLAGLRELDIENKIVVLKPIQVKKVGDIELEAYIVEQGSIYIIFIKELSKSKSISTIAHELIHLQQYIDDRILIEGDTLIWDFNTIYSKSNLPEYMERPWEIEAYKISNTLENKIETTLYEKE